MDIDRSLHRTRLHLGVVPVTACLDVLMAAGLSEPNVNTQEKVDCHQTRANNIRLVPTDLITLSPSVKY